MSCIKPSSFPSCRNVASGVLMYKSRAILQNEREGCFPDQMRDLFSKRADSYNRADVAAGGAETGSLPQPAVPRGRRCCSWQCCNEGGCLSEVISVVGRAAAGRCRGGRVSAMGRILRRTREAPPASAVQNEGRHCCAAERSRPECQPAALRSRRRESGAKGPL